MAEDGSKVKTPLRGMQRFLADMRRYDREQVERRFRQLPPETTVGDLLPGRPQARTTFYVRVVHPRRPAA